MLGSSRMADVKPFRAERYDVAKAGPLEQLVAPPYDVISPAERDAYFARSPFNVVHLTLPETEEQAARELADWRAQGVLARDREPGSWVLSQDYVGPDGIQRTRSGLVASLRAEPYERSEEHTSELQSRLHLVCRLLLEKKKTQLVSNRHRKLKTNTDYRNL